jgi:TfoX/Sxy family transcriptional regulator of competence genes
VAAHPVGAGGHDRGVAYDEDLADRVRALTDRERGITEKRMFGGLALLLNGNMAVVVRGKGGLMVRYDPADAQTILAEPGAEPAHMRGRDMRGWAVVDPSGVHKPADLKRWVTRALTFTRTLPPK